MEPKAISFKPDYPQAWNTKGEVLTNLGEINEAIKAYNVTIEIISNQEAHEIPRLGKIKYKALNKKGLAFVRIEQFKEAAAEFGKALDIDPNSHATWRNKGLAFVRIGKLEESLKAFDRVTTLKPNSYEVWNYKGFALEDLGRLQEAILAFDKAVTVNPNFVAALNNKRHHDRAFARPARNRL